MVNMNSEQWLTDRLETLRKTFTERSIFVVPEAGGIVRDLGNRIINLSSNDYQNLGCHPATMAGAKEALERYGCGATASRLVTGTLPIHEELEAVLASWMGAPTSLVFGSGFLTNHGVIQALMGRDDVIFTDRLIHASIVDAMVGSRATIKRFRHNDTGHLADLLKSTPVRGRRLVVTESVFSMDGDLAPLQTIVELCEAHDAWCMVDEAHALGVFGPLGAGRVREEQLTGRIQLIVGTLGKGLGSYGGFVACSDRMRQWLINRARSFIYSTALPASVLGAALGALRVLHEEPERGSILLARARQLRHRFNEDGVDTMLSSSQIIPVVLGDNQATLDVANKLREKRILAVPIRPPTVPEGTSRLRLSLSYAHTDTDLLAAADSIVATIGGMR